MPWIFKWAPPGTSIDNAIPLEHVRYRSFHGGSGPPFTPVNEEVPFLPGSNLKFIDVGESEVDLTILIQGSGETDLWNRVRALQPYFTPNKGLGTLDGVGGGKLIVTTPATPQQIRFLDCICISGLKINEESLQYQSVEATLTFYANYPYWQAYPAHTTTLTLSGQSAEWFPIFPLILGAANQARSNFTIHNAGDAPSYMSVFMQGPGRTPIVQNATGTPYSLAMTQGNLESNVAQGLILGGGQTATADFREKTLIKTGVTANQANQIYTLSLDSNFFPLLPGDNNITFWMTRITASTVVQITWYDTYSSFA